MRGAGRQSHFVLFLKSLDVIIFLHFLWPFVSASFHSNNHQQAVWISVSSLRTADSKQGQNQHWVEEEKVPNSSLMPCVCVCQFAVQKPMFLCVGFSQYCWAVCDIFITCLISTWGKVQWVSDLATYPKPPRYRIYVILKTKEYQMSLQNK